MLKKIFFLLTTPVVLLLTGCERQQISGIRQEGQSIPNVVAEFSLETFPFHRHFFDGPIENRRHGMTLTDLLTNEVLEKFILGEFQGVPNGFFELRGDIMECIYRDLWERVSQMAECPLG